MVELWVIMGDQDRHGRRHGSSQRESWVLENFPIKSQDIGKLPYCVYGTISSEVQDVGQGLITREER